MKVAEMPSEEANSCVFVELHVHKQRSNGPRVCEICGKHFPSISAYEKHQVTHTGEKSWACSYCTKTFSTKTNLKSHEATHDSRKKSFVCEICDSAFYNKHSLQHHTRFVHTDANERVKCQLCWKELKNKNILRKHHKLLHPNNQSDAELCRRTTEREKQVSENIARLSVAESSLTSICEVCGKVFEHEKALEIHLSKQHKSQALKQCNLCHKKVLNYYNHMKMHRSYDKGEYRSCTICGKSFPLKAYLHQHMQLHQKPKYSCHTCLKEFHFKCALQSHLKSGRCYHTIRGLKKNVVTKNTWVNKEYLEKTGDAFKEVFKKDTEVCETAESSSFAVGLHNPCVVISVNNSQVDSADSATIPNAYSVFHVSKSCSDIDGYSNSNSVMEQTRSVVHSSANKAHDHNYTCEEKNNCGGSTCKRIPPFEQFEIQDHKYSNEKKNTEKCSDVTELQSDESIAEQSTVYRVQGMDVEAFFQKTNQSKQQHLDCVVLLQDPRQTGSDNVLQLMHLGKLSDFGPELYCTP